MTTGKEAFEGEPVSQVEDVLVYLQMALDSGDRADLHPVVGARIQHAIDTYLEHYRPKRELADLDW